MDLNRPITRLLVILLVAAIPPLVAFAIVSVVAEDWLASAGKGTALLIGTALAIVWAGLVATVGSRQLNREMQSMIDLARRGVMLERGTTAGEETLSQAQRRLAATLDERNRQIAELAVQAHAAPITEDAPTAARSMVAAARSLTGDPTWSLAVLRVEPEGLLTPGVYTESSGAPGPTEDVHRWASTLDPEIGGRAGARHAIGPWGGFVVVDVGAGEHLRAILLAPWEGRAPPSPAELDLMALLGEHASTAIEHALLYTQLRLQTDELNRVAAVQTDFLRGITHDLQTPLTSIRALAAEIQDVGGLSESARADLATIAHQADRLRRMVGQLLVVSRLEARELTPRQEVFRLAPLIERTWSALRADRTFALTQRGPAHLAVADPDRLEQVLWAILDNAVKYSQPGSGVRVEISARPSDDHDDALEADIAITDEGAGMSSDTREHAFEQFYRSQDARRLAPDGSGVGLYAARGLVRAMGGEIALTSRLGAGTTVTITLPAEPAEDAHDAAAAGDRTEVTTA
jgi:signal transduction histidine kinase